MPIGFLVYTHHCAFKPRNPVSEVQLSGSGELTSDSQLYDTDDNDLLFQHAALLRGHGFSEDRSTSRASEPSRTGQPNPHDGSLSSVSVVLDEDPPHTQRYESPLSPEPLQGYRASGRGLYDSQDDQLLVRGSNAMVNDPRIRLKV